MLQSPGRKFSWLIALILLTSCIARPVDKPAFSARAVTIAPAWQLADVRLLDGLDSADPGAELVALYTRFLQEGAQIRLDFLDLAQVADFDILLALDTHAGGAAIAPEIRPELLDSSSQVIAWDYLIEIQATGAIHIFRHDASSGWGLHSPASVRVLRDPLQGIVEVHLGDPSRPAFSPKSRLQVWTLLPDGGRVLDSSGVVIWNGLPPQSLPVILAFSDVFQAFTPSQGLRKWDGAHTGPAGGRHGLGNLLRTARAHGIPLLLLDAANPASLAALDYQGGLALIKTMTRQGLLSLASPLPPGSQDLPDSIKNKFLEENERALQAYGLPSTDWIYTPILLEDGYAQISLAPALALSISPDGHPTLILPAFYNPSPSYQPAAESLPQALRQYLVTQALAAQSQSNSFLLLGGSLPQSSWGSPQAARAAFRYLKAHPWLRIAHPRELLLNATLALLPGSAPKVSLPTGLKPPDLLDQLTLSPADPLTQAAWSSYRAAFAPVFPYPTRLLELRQSYLGESHRLLTAAQWARDPEIRQDCSQDLDQDGQVECLFANQSVLAIVQPTDAVLEGVFTLAQDGVHQLSASSAQLISGLSDPLDWEETDGQLLDPQVVRGALSSGGGPYQTRFTDGKLILQESNGNTYAILELLPDGIHVQLSQASPGSRLSIPLLLDPWLRFSPLGLISYSAETIPTGFRWRAGGTAALVFEASAPFSTQVYTSSRASLAATEDPNFEYPPGHSLPYPLAVIHLQADFPCDFSLRLVQP